MENPINMDDFGVPLFLETPQSDHAFTFHQKTSLLLNCKAQGADCDHHTATE